MNEKEKISIIVPIYNVEKYLNECIDSIINQTYKNLEIILVDDGSTDSSSNICDEYKNKDDRIKVFHKNNGGQSIARNYGIEKASGDFLFFVDSDDYIDKNTISSLYDDLKKYDVDIACCTYNRIFDNKKEYYGDNENNIYIFNKEDALRFMLSGYGAVSVWGKIYKKNLFLNNRFINVLYEDLEIIPRLLINTNKISYSMKPLYQWRFYSNSLSNAPLEKGWSNKLIAYKITYDYISKNYSSLTKDILKKFIEMSLSYLYKTIYIKNNYSERNNLAREILFLYSSNNIFLDKKEKREMFFLKYGLIFFDIAHKIKDTFKN